MSPMPESTERDLERLLAEEAFVRGLAEQLVAGDADEVVQRTWLCAVQQGGRGVEQPRHWLARIVRNVIANLRRADRRRHARERAVASVELVPSSQELAEREERRRALVAAVDALPGTLRTVVLLRWFDGRPPREIAQALGVPAATVSTQLHRALALLRQRLDAQHGGDRRAWLVPLVPIALRPELPPAATTIPVAAASTAPALLLGAIAMTTKTKFAAAAAVALAAVGVWVTQLDDDAPAVHPILASDATPPALVQAPLATPTTAPASPEQPAREAASPTTPVASTATGTVIVHVRHGDGSPAAEAVLTLSAPGSDTRYEGIRRRTDAVGTARFDDVSPGRFNVGNCLSPPKRVDVHAGQTIEVTLELATDLTVTGVVVDAAHSPVGGALVEVTRMASHIAFPEVLAVTGADGRFIARACPTPCLLGARAFGHVASPVRFVQGKEGNTAEIELVLGRDGGGVAGTVVDATGKAVVAAIVIVGRGELSGIPGREHILPFPALARTDEQGQFLAVGVAAGSQPLRVRANGCAPWTGTVDVMASATSSVRIDLAAGAVVGGHALDATGAPVDGADIRVGDSGDLAHFRARSAADGTWQLTGLPIGELTIRGEHRHAGKAEQIVRTSQSSPTRCELRFSRGLELRGRLLDPDGQPVTEAMVECAAEWIGNQRWSATARTDAKGRFVAANCPETGKLTVVVRARGFEEVRQRGIDPRTELVVHLLQGQLPPTVRIRGRVLDPEGRPVPNASVFAFRSDKRGSSRLRVTDDDGNFELEPVLPGTWTLNVNVADHPEHRSKPQPLAADATWDLGTIELVRGGTAEIRCGTTPEGTEFCVVDALRTATWSVTSEGKVRRTGALAPGNYRLLVEGKAVAAMAVPFTIREGEQAHVDVEVQRGVEQVFHCMLPHDAEVDGVSLAVLRDAEFVGRTWADMTNDGASRAIVLAPGDYTVEAVAGELRGRATFTVGATSGAPVTVALR